MLIHVSERSNHGIFALRILGRSWTVVTHGALLQQINRQPNDTLESKSAQWWLLCRVFGAAKEFKQAFLDAKQDLHESLSLSDPHQPELPTLLRAIIQRIQSQVPNLVSFSEGLVDQNPWERSGRAELVQNEVAEVELFALIRAAVGHTTLPSLLGTEFLDVYPGVFDDLRDLDDSLKYLLLGLPRWFPIPSLVRANVARRRLDNAIDSFHKALDKAAIGSKLDPPWYDMSDVSQEMKARCTIWRKHDLPPAVKGPLDLQMLWA